MADDTGADEAEDGSALRFSSLRRQPTLPRFLGLCKPCRRQPCLRPAGRVGRQAEDEDGVAEDLQGVPEECWLIRRQWERLQRPDRFRPLPKPSRDARRVLRPGRRGAAAAAGRAGSAG